MGLFDVAKKAANVGTGGLFGQITGDNVQGPPGMGQIDPNIEKLRKAQADNAERFRGNLAGYRNDQIGQAQDQSRKELAAQLAGVTSGMNRRGILYSGLNQGAQAGARAQAASQLAGNITDINRNAEDTAFGLEQGAVAAGLQGQKMQQERENQLYQQALAYKQSKNAGLNGLMGGAGSAIGMIAGG